MFIPFSLSQNYFLLFLKCRFMIQWFNNVLTDWSKSEWKEQIQNDLSQIWDLKIHRGIARDPKEEMIHIITLRIECEGGWSPCGRERDTVVIDVEELYPWETIINSIEKSKKLIAL